MQDAGLVVREPAEYDRRVMVVHLTDKGRAMREPLAAMWRDLEATSTQHLTAQQAETFVRDAYAVIDAISGRTQPPEEPA
jgi:DNA-binding MarR family transcriptional regulator